MAPHGWDPDQYHRFRRQRRKPFFDLLRRVNPAHRAVDLGCGTGELTRVLARCLRPAEVVGVDSSPAMLEQAARHARDGLQFREADIMDVDLGGFDLLFSNAALHWIPDHPVVFRHLVDGLPDGAQLAVQVPYNDAHPSHRLIRELAAGAFAERLGGFVRQTPVLDPAAYRTLLGELGCRDIQVEARIYEHEMPSVEAVAEWTRGTTLLPYLDRLSAPDQAELLDAYRAALRDALSDVHPYSYEFQRLLMSAVVVH